MSLPERVCAREGCSETFTPRNNTHIYHTTGCGLKVSNDSRTHGPTTELRMARDDIKRLEREVRFFQQSEAHVRKPPEWLSPKSADDHHGTVCVLISDWHFDEVVDPAQIDYLNRYNRKIGEARFQRMFEKAIVLARDYLKGITYDGLVAMFCGDMFSGTIHEELTETNEASILESFLYWQEPILSGLRLWAKDFEKVHVVSVPGNHTRLSKKPRAKGAAHDTFDWLLMRQIQKQLEADNRFTWNLPDALDAHLKIYDFSYLLTHGDQFRGGAGISGAVAPLMTGSYRKSKRQMLARRPYNLMCLGHWHQYMTLPSKGFVVNGAGKGYDEFAWKNNYDYEDPQQAFWISTPEHGPAFWMPLLVGDRKTEGW